MSNRMGRVLAFAVLCGVSSPSFAWGERGHNAIARIASRLVAIDKDPETAAFGALLQRKEHMLGHLANVPDIVWRSAGKDIEDLNAPCHYIHLEYIHFDGRSSLQPKDYPKDIEAYKKLLEISCSKQPELCATGKTDAERLSKAGHAPFRIQQLSQDLTKVFADLKKLNSDPKATAEAKNALIDQALLIAGIMAHFVGDLANPHHTTDDYDGWRTAQGGLHGYFETDMVNTLGLDLDQKVFLYTQATEPAQKMFAKSAKDPLTMAWELAASSHQLLGKLIALDEKNSLLQKSDRSKHSRAQRKSPTTVVNRYEDFIVDRLASGADALAAFWIAAWNAGGRPKFDGYQSYQYQVRPDFLPTPYAQTSEVSAGQVK